jgi:hypothetical protein
VSSEPGAGQLAIFFAIFLRLSPNKFLRIPLDLSPVSIRLASAWLRRSWWVVYGQSEGKPLAIRITAKADVARSGPTSPKGLADLKQGSTIQLSGKSRPWGIKAQKVLI